MKCFKAVTILFLHPRRRLFFQMNQVWRYVKHTNQNLNDSWPIIVIVVLPEAKKSVRSLKWAVLGFFIIRFDFRCLFLGNVLKIPYSCKSPFWTTYNVTWHWSLFISDFKITSHFMLLPSLNCHWIFMSV